MNTDVTVFNMGSALSIKFSAIDHHFPHELDKESLCFYPSKAGHKFDPVFLHVRSESLMHKILISDTQIQVFRQPPPLRNCLTQAHADYLNIYAVARQVVPYSCLCITLQGIRCGGFVHEL